MIQHIENTTDNRENLTYDGRRGGGRTVPLRGRDGAGGGGIRLPPAGGTGGCRLLSGGGGGARALGLFLPRLPGEGDDGLKEKNIYIYIFTTHPFYKYNKNG